MGWPELWQAGEALFRDRREAGARLAACLAAYRGPDVLVLGIPRGGVVVAAEVARRLDAELDVIVARKIPAPTSPELAIGAVTASGERLVDAELVRTLGVPASYLEAAVAAETAEARRREARFRGDAPPPAVFGRTVLVVDDGLATGATMRAAVQLLRARGPARLVVGVPVGAPQACALLRREADEVVCLYEPDPFYAVGLYYERFEQTGDAEVAELLREARARRAPGPPGGGPEAP